MAVKMGLRALLLGSNIGMCGRLSLFNIACALESEDTGACLGTGVSLGLESV